MSVFREIKELGYGVEVEVESHSIQFGVYKITAETLEGAPCFGENYSVDYRDTCPAIEGFVKWDGCINFMFEEGYWHACEREELVKIGLILAACRDLAAELLPTWDKEVAGE